MKRLVALLLFASAASGQRPPDMPLSAAERAQIVEAAAVRIDKFYVEAEKGREIASDLRASLRDGAFDAATTALALVPAVNHLLQIKGDKHLRFGYSAKADAQPEDAPETPEQLAADLRDSRRAAFGIRGVTRLAGNVALLTWAKFEDPDVGGDALAAAMRLLQSSDALIIDLRESDGGSPHMVSLFVSYFMPQGDPILLSEVSNRFKGTSEQFWTAGWLPERRYLDRDVFILTSNRTWSAGEGFAEHMRRLRHSTIVGEKTKGGARLSRWMRIHPHFAISVSVAKHVGPPGLVDWEGVGIRPDIDTAAADALSTAHLLALRKLLERAADEDSREFLREAIASISR